MPVIAFVLFIIAAVLFGLAFLDDARHKAVPLGLCLFTVAVILQFTIHGSVIR